MGFTDSLTCRACEELETEDHLIMLWTSLMKERDIIFDPFRHPFLLTRAYNFGELDLSFHNIADSHKRYHIVGVPGYKSFLSRQTVISPLDSQICGTVVITYYSKKISLFFQII